MTLRAIPPDAPGGERERIEYAGVAALSPGLVALLLALDQSAEWGWGDWRVIAFAAACPVLLFVFGLVERRASAAALVPRDVIANRNFAAACLAVLLMSAVVLRGAAPTCRSS